MKSIILYSKGRCHECIFFLIYRKEIKAVQYLAYARATIMSFFFSAGAFVSLITFMTYVLSGNKLTAQKVFTSVALFNIARSVFTVYLPIGITFMMELKVAIDRIQVCLPLYIFHFCMFLIW